MQGLIEGMKVVSGIIEQFWDTLYPELNEPNELYRRMNVVMKFMNKFGDKLGLIPITNPNSSEAIPYTWANYNDASFVDKLPANEQKAAIENGRATTALFGASLKATPNDFILSLNDSCEQLLSSVQQLEDTLVEKCEALREQLDEKSDADVSFSQAREALDIFMQFSQRIIKERGLRKPEPPKQATATQPSNTDASATTATQQPLSGGYSFGSGVGVGQVQSRDDAYNALDNIADFLIMAEPHSPVPYLLKRAVKWGRMSGQDMFRELYTNAADLNTLFRLLDIGEYDSSMPYSAPMQTPSYQAPQQQQASDNSASQQQAPANDPYAGW